MGVFVFSSVLGSFIAAGLQCANITVNTVTTFTQSISFIFLLFKYPGFWLATINIRTVVKYSLAHILMMRPDQDARLT